MRGRAIALAVVVLLGGTGCSTLAQRQPAAFSVAGCEPKSLIPQNHFEDRCAEQVLEGLFTRLMDYDPQTRKLTNALAESVTTAPDDPLTTILKIKDGYTFHNGEPVTAQSFVDTWNWQARQGSVWFSDFQGFSDLNPGEGEEPTATTLSGLRAIGRLTIRFTLVAPLSTAMLALSMDDFDPLPTAFFRDPKAWEKIPIGEGPYQMAGPWQHNQVINLKRYPDYAGTPGRADRIAIHLAGGGLVDLVRGDLDISRIRADEFDPARQELGPRSLESVVRFIPYETSRLIYLGFPLYNPRFGSRELRQAISLAIDRDRIVQRSSAAMAATSLLNPALPGYRDGACGYCHLDVAQARAKLAAAGGWQGRLIIEVGEEEILDVQAVADQLRENLGIADVVVIAEGVVDHVNRLNDFTMRGPFSWSPDFIWPSPENYLEPSYQTDGWSNDTRYSNPEVDRLMAQANAAGTLSEGVRLFQRAEDVTLEDMPVIPLLYPEESWGYSMGVSDIEFTAFGLVRLELVSVSGS
jgi:oligopeptide transport system substrate-binding protein